MSESSITAIVSEVERCTTVDGPGIRTIVFLKGCPLHCLWCHNPENIAPQLQVGWDDSRCIGCMKCIDVCESKAITSAENVILTDFTKCTACHKCVDICPAKARKQFGSVRSVEEIFAEVVKDKPFYDKTHGGVTVSGGEPLSQPYFTKELFRLCREAGIHTALDTSGFATREVLDSVLRETDMVLLDIKQVVPALHISYTGVDIAPVLATLKRIEELGISTWIRTPIVPGYTDQEENIVGIAELLADKKCVKKWEMLPYHSFGKKKYSEIQKEYLLHSVERPPDEKMKRLREIAVEICGERIAIK